MGERSEKCARPVENVGVRYQQMICKNEKWALQILGMMQFLAHMKVAYSQGF